MIRIGISVLNFEAAGETLRCIESLLDARDQSSLSLQLEIRVGDNASTEADWERLRSGLQGASGVSLVRHSRNLGFAAGHNRNLAALLDHDVPDFIWLLNNDCIVGEGVFDALSSCARRRPGVGIWGATLLEMDGRNVQCAGGCSYRAWLTSYRPFGRGEVPERIEGLEPPAFDYIAGASMFMPTSTLLDGIDPPPGHSQPFENQWLNEEFFLYFEELDLARRLRPGLELGWCAQAIIRHSGGLGTGSGNGKRSATGEYHSTLSALKFTRLHSPGLLWIAAPARFAAKAIYNLATLRPDLLGALVTAYRDFFRWRSNPRR